MKLDLFLSRLLRIAVIMTCSAVTWLAIVLGRSTPPVLTKVGEAAGQLSADLKTVDTSVGHLDAQLNGEGGLIPSAARAAQGITEIGNRVTRKDGALENLELSARSLNNTILDVHGRLTNKDGILDNTDAAIRDVRVNLVQVSRAQTKYYTEDAPQMTHLITSAADLLADKNLADALKNMAETSQHTASITGHVDAIAADIQGSVHKSLHPSKKSLFFGGLWTALKVAATHIP
jgi:hypothetical protein